jgi:hypothetical protein
MSIYYCLELSLLKHAYVIIGLISNFVTHKIFFIKFLGKTYAFYNKLILLVIFLMGLCQLLNHIYLTTIKEELALFMDNLLSSFILNFRMRSLTLISVSLYLR